MASPSKTPKSQAIPATPQDTFLTETQLREIIQKATHGDETNIAVIRELMTHPGQAERYKGNLGGEVLRLATAIEAFKNCVKREAVTATLKTLRADLEGPSPTPLEKLLVERILVNWVFLHHVERKIIMDAACVPALEAVYQKTLERAQRRYLASIRALAEIRRLAVPVVQINVARKQTNIANTAAAE